MSFSTGETVKLRYGNPATIVRKLGEGGQGIVYEVKVDGKSYALKWYTQTFPDKVKFIKNLCSNIDKGAPDKRFLWPLYFAEEQNDSFGYVMELRPQGYAEFVDILCCRVVPSMDIRILAALNIVRGFRSLHEKGYSYQDLNDGNFFINVDNGDILICDNDNVTAGNEKNSGGVGGKPGYMAPEVVTGQSGPGQLTDYHSLAVILFKLFIMHDPLMGTAYHSVDIVGPEEQMALYGKNPVFIFDPHNSSNKPKDGVDIPAIQLWPMYPKFFQDTFIKAFAEGMKNPNARVDDYSWQRTLIQLRDEYSVCPNCQRLMETPWCNVNPMHCNCGTIHTQPIRLSVGTYKVPLFQKQKLYAPHTTGKNDDYERITGEIVSSKNDRSKLGIKNISDDIWSFFNQKGEVKRVGKNEVVPILAAGTIDFARGIQGKVLNGQEVFISPLYLFVKDYRVSLLAEQQLFACHTSPGNDQRTITGKIVTNKNDPSKLALRNLSTDTWEFVSPVTGQKVYLEPNKVIPLDERDIRNGIVVNFKGISGRIAKKIN